MRLLVRTGVTPSEWFSSGSGERERGDSLGLARNHVILITPEVEESKLIADVVRADSQEFPDRLKDALASFIKGTPRSLPRPGVAVDLDVGNVEESSISFNDAFGSFSETYKDAIDRAEYFTESRSTRSEAFDNSLGLVLPAVTQVHLIDRFAATAITQDGWLLKQMLKYPDLDVSVFSGFPDKQRANPNESDASLISRLKDAVEHALRAQADYRGRLQISIFNRTNGKLHHHRRLQLRFDNNATINVNLDKGAGTFSSNPMGAPTHFPSYPPGEFTNQKTLWIQTAGVPLKLEWTGEG